MLMKMGQHIGETGADMEVHVDNRKTGYALKVH